MTQQNAARPVRTIRCGNIAASVWRNKANIDGRIVVRHSVRFQKRFRKKDGSYEDTPYLYPDDIPKLVVVAQEIFKFICLKEGKPSEDAVST